MGTEWVMSELNNQNFPHSGETIAIVDRLVSSDAFKALFRDGMSLVEDTAAYLDGPGRLESRQLERNASLAYASESMRLTTRLMQMTSWLLLQRAVNEGELSRDEAEREHRKVKIAPQDSGQSPEAMLLLPQPLQDLNERSKRLNKRILRLDEQLHSDPANAPEVNPVRDQLSALKSALGI